MQITRYLGLSLPVRTSTQDGQAIDQNLSGLAYSSPPSVWDKTTNPTAIDDSNHGYYVGARWLNRVTVRVWICTDDTPGAAVWQDIVQVAANLGAKNAINLTAFGDASDGSICYVTTPSTRWEWLPSGSSTWQAITTVSGKWTVSGTTLTLDKSLWQFADVTVPSGTTLYFGSSTYEFPLIKVRNTLNVQGTLRGQLNGFGQRFRAGEAKTIAGAGNGVVDNGLATACITSPCPSGSGGGAAQYTGGNGRTRDSNRPYWVIYTASPSAVPVTTTVGTSPSPYTGASAVQLTFVTSPRLPGADGFPGGGGALSKTGGSSKGGAGSGGSNLAPVTMLPLGAFGGGIIQVQAYNLVIGASATLSSNGENALNAEDADASGADQTIAGGGGGGAGGSGGQVLIQYVALTVNGVDYSADPYNASVLAHVTANGGSGGTGGAGKTRLDDDTALTPWAATTAYTLGNFRRPPTANGYGYVCTTAGTSNGTQPPWPLNAGDPVNDGTVIWTCIAEGSNIINTAFKGGNGVAGVSGVVVIERVPQ